MNSRIITFISLVVLMAHHSFAQGDPNETLQRQSLLKYKNMKEGGKALIVIGGILVVTGIGIEIHQAGEEWSNTSPEPVQGHNNRCKDGYVAKLGQSYEF